eukprot:3094551-Pyramimonas_sp.AAC.1
MRFWLEGGALDRGEHGGGSDGAVLAWHRPLQGVARVGRPASQATKCMFKCMSMGPPWVIFDDWT